MLHLLRRISCPDVCVVDHDQFVLLSLYARACLHIDKVSDSAQEIQEMPWNEEEIYLEILMPNTGLTTAQRVIFLRDFLSPKWSINIIVSILVIVIRYFIFNPCDF